MKVVPTAAGPAGTPETVTKPKESGNNSKHKAWC